MYLLYTTVSVRDELLLDQQGDVVIVFLGLLYSAYLRL
jgi:hypothetical protein